MATELTKTQVDLTSRKQNLLDQFRDTIEKLEKLKGEGDDISD
jgi:hypothetical protein